MIMTFGPEPKLTRIDRLLWGVTSFMRRVPWIDRWYKVRLFKRLSKGMNPEIAPHLQESNDLLEDIPFLLPIDAAPPDQSPLPIRTSLPSGKWRNWT